MDFGLDIVGCMGTILNGIYGDPFASQGATYLCRELVFLAFIITVAMLHIFNNISIPVTFLGSKSVSLFSGVQDAMVQWWYGHNAVGFFFDSWFSCNDVLFYPKAS